MKKVLLFAIVVGGLAFTSCSKSGCECTVAGTSTTTDDVSEDDCKAANDVYTASGVDGSCKTV
ncbi:MAG: hypothetical protein COB15_12540 [Flavobacteriales bacterium]|nr:MAG: hypothetical protein COB15_12540 [Flavobacteriales bacterium]